MSIKTMDNISELMITLKKAKAVSDAFGILFTSGDKKTIMLDIENNFDNFTHLEAVLSDLVSDAVEQVTELEAAANQEESKPA